MVDKDVYTTEQMARVIVYLAGKAEEANLSISEDAQECVYWAEEVIRASTCPHSERCGGYGGWWAQEVGEGAGWATPPEDTDDGIGYVMCQCMVKTG